MRDKIPIEHKMICQYETSRRAMVPFFWLFLLAFGGLYGGIAMLLDPSGGLKILRKQ